MNPIVLQQSIVATQAQGELHLAERPGSLVAHLMQESEISLSLLHAHCWPRLPTPSSPMRGKPLPLSCSRGTDDLYRKSKYDVKPCGQITKLVTKIGPMHDPDTSRDERDKFAQFTNFLMAFVAHKKIQIGPCQSIGNGFI